GDDLDLVTDHLGQARVEDALVRVGDDVRGHDRVLGVLQGAGHRTLGDGLDGGVDLLDRHLARGGEGEVGGGAGDDRDAQRVAVELALELGQHEGDRLGGAGGGRHDVLRGGAGATQVAVRAVLQVLVAGVGVDRGHETTLDADRVVERLGQRREAVGRAGGVRDDVVRGRVVVGVVDTDDERGVLVLRGRGDDDLLGAGVDVRLGLGRVGEEAGGLDDDVGAELAPREVGRVAFLEGADLLAVGDDGLVFVARVRVGYTGDGVVLEQVGEGLVVGQVVHADDLDVGARGEDRPVEVPTDTAEAVDSDADGHDVPPGASGARSVDIGLACAHGCAGVARAAATYLWLFGDARRPRRPRRASRYTAPQARDPGRWSVRRLTRRGSEAVEHLRREARLGVRDALGVRLLVGHREQPPDAACDGVLGQRRGRQLAGLLEAGPPVLHPEPARLHEGRGPPRAAGLGRPL